MAACLAWTAGRAGAANRVLLQAIPEVSPKRPLSNRDFKNWGGLRVATCKSLIPGPVASPIGSKPLRGIQGERVE